MVHCGRGRFRAPVSGGTGVDDAISCAGKERIARPQCRPMLACSTQLRSKNGRIGGSGKPTRRSHAPNHPDDFCGVSSRYRLGGRLDNRPGEGEPQRSTFSIGVLPVARLTGPSTRRSVRFSVGRHSLARQSLRTVKARLQPRTHHATDLRPLVPEGRREGASHH